MAQANGPNGLALVVAPGQQGRIDDHQIDVSQIAPGGTIRLLVKVSDLNFRLAAAEFAVIFDPFLVRVRDTPEDFTGSNPPIKALPDWGTTELLELPVDAEGNRTNWGVRNTWAWAKFGGLITNPDAYLDGPAQPGQTWTLAEMEFTLGNGEVSTCISTTSTLELAMCATMDHSYCPYFADETGAARTMTDHGRTVVLIHPDPGVYEKADADFSGSLTPADITPIVYCTMSSLGGWQGADCPLSTAGISEAEAIQILDMSCDGQITAADLLANITRVMHLVAGKQAVEKSGSPPVKIKQQQGKLLLKLKKQPQSPLHFGQLEWNGLRIFDARLKQNGLHSSWTLVQESMEGRFSWLLLDETGVANHYPVIELDYEVTDGLPLVAVTQAVAIQPDGALLPQIPALEEASGKNTAQEVQ